VTNRKELSRLLKQLTDIHPDNTDPALALAYEALKLASNYVAANLATAESASAMLRHCNKELDKAWLESMSYANTHNAK
jgi:hypothetical protein